MTFAVLAAAFATGLLGSLHCVGMCGAFAASCARARFGLPAWHLGRILTYALLGALAGAMGRILPGPPWIPGAVAAVLLVWFALGLAGLVPEPRFALPGLAAAGSRAAGTLSLGAQFAFGLVNGFLPCGLVYSALGVPVALAHPLDGALAMLAFGLGTVPALSVAAVGVQRLVLSSLARRRLFALLVLGTGLWVIWKRTNSDMLTGHHHHPAQMPAESHLQGSEQ
ncbi:MAG TPA: sulfite exporter TauE/SafE family protein [Gemmatimonadales bacterium]|nr:sulfite exporter TauE/SafE family protein [Gemmatimonadales bacterium]